MARTGGAALEREHPREEGWRQLKTARYMLMWPQAPLSLPLAYYFMYLFYFLSSSYHYLKPFPPCLTPHFPVHAGTQRVANQREVNEAGLQRPAMASHSIWSHCSSAQGPRVCKDLLRSWCLSSVQPCPHFFQASILWRPWSISLIVSAELKEVARLLIPISEQALWCVRGCWSGPLRVRAGHHRAQDLEGTAFHNVTFQPTGASSLRNPECAVA